MAVSGTQGSSHAAHAGHDAKPAGTKSSDAPKSVGETKKPDSQAKASAENVGAKPSGKGSAAAGQARDGATMDPKMDMGMPMAGGADHAEGAHAGGHDPVPAGSPNLKGGTTGPVVKKAEAPTIEIPDGPGFHGVEGRKQNGDDKKQNNYSVTDANFNTHLGLMDKDPDTGKPMTYVQDIQTYNAAGYIDAFAPKTAAKLEQAQQDGKGMILEGSAYLMGLTKTKPDYLDAYGIDGADIPANIPGTNRSSRDYVGSAKDVTGQDWARMHHPESAWDMYKGLVNAGVDGEKALRLSGDDGVSGAGRLNGMNNQDGNNGFNAGEVEVWKEAAQLQQQTGIPVIQTMMAGHNHVGLDPSAMTDPAANKLLGITGTQPTADRANAVFNGLLSGKLDEKNNGGGDGGGGKAEGAGGGGGGETEGAGGGGGADEADGAGEAGGAEDATGGGGEFATLLANALTWLQTNSPEVYAQLMQMQQAGQLDATTAAGMVMGLFDDPATSANSGIPPEQLTAIQTVLDTAKIGRAGVDPRIALPQGVTGPIAVADAGAAALAGGTVSPAVEQAAGGAAGIPGVAAPALVSPVAPAAAGHDHAAMAGMASMPGMAGMAM